MNHMFYKAEAFNQDISGWNVGQVTNSSEIVGVVTHSEPNCSDHCPELGSSEAVLV